jgi:hypothetical protein
MKNKKKSFLLIPHSKECRCKHWSGIVDGSYYGNYAGNEKVTVGRYHLWHKVSCNDPNCKGIKSVHSSVLADA